MDKIGGGEMNRDFEVEKKGWEDLTTEEKMERIRRQVKSLQMSNAKLQTLVEKLMKHEHLNGELVMPLKQYGDCPSEGKMPCKNNKLYF